MTGRVAIVGSIDYRRPDLVQTYVRGLPGDAIVVSGGAPGVDTFAETAAAGRGLETVIFHAEWERLGRRAGPIRNAQIIAHADRVVAFWNGRSRGTLNSLVLAKRAALPVETYGPDGERVELEHALKVAEERGVYASIAVGKRRAAELRKTKGA